MTDRKTAHILTLQEEDDLATFQFAGTEINRSPEMLHYKFRTPLIGLLENLARAYQTGRTKSRFKLFEGFRSPMRQDALFEQGSTKARAWQSAHQYGLAADVVVLDGSTWSWKPEHDWRFLKLEAQRIGLSVPIENDRCHVQSMVWQKLRTIVF